MTKPTQAQIEAAAKAMEREMFAPHELPLDDELHDKYLVTAEAALAAAAAEVGPQVSDITMQRYTELKEENYRLQDIEEKTIERCVQWIMEYTDLTTTQKLNIATKIRTLKEKP